MPAAGCTWASVRSGCRRIARRGRNLLTTATDCPTLDSSQLTIHGWRMLQTGQREQAQRYFRAALHYDPHAVGAWLGLSRAVDTWEERRACLQAAIDLEHLVNDLE